MATGRKFVNVQVLRLVAALLVVGTHATLYTSERLRPGDVWHFGEVGVDLFFVISGFVMMTSSWRHLHEPGYGRVFLLRRLVRIGPMYWIATTMNLVLLAVLPSLVPERPSALRVLLSYLFVSTRSPTGRMEPLHGVGWTLVFEMAFYLVFAVALALRANVLLVCVVVFTACTAGGLLRPDRFTSPAWVYLDPVVLYFVAGLVIGRWVCDRATRPALLWMAYLLVVWTLNALLRSGGDAFAWHLLLRPVLVTVVVVAVVLLEPLTRTRVPAPLVLLGDASYSLYLFHPFIGPVVVVVLARLGLGVPWVSVALVLLASVVGSAVLYAVVERPLTRALQRWTPGLRPHPQATSEGAPLALTGVGTRASRRASRRFDEPG